MSLIDRVKNITLQPNIEWPVIAAEPSSVGGLYTGYVAPLAAINPIAIFIGLSIVGVSIPFVGTYRTPFFAGISHAVVSFVLALLGVFLMAFIVNALAPTFSARPDLNAAFKLVAYSATPGFVAGILSIFPPLAILETLAALWGLYVFYVGLPILMQAPREKALPYTALCIVCAFVIGLVVSVTVGAAFGVSRLAMGGLGPNIYGVSSPHDRDAQAAAVAATVLGNAMGGSESDKQQAQSMVSSVAQAGKMPMRLPEPATPRPRRRPASTCSSRWSRPARARSRRSRVKSSRRCCPIASSDCRARPRTATRERSPGSPRPERPRTTVTPGGRTRSNSTSATWGTWAGSPCSQTLPA